MQSRGGVRLRAALALVVFVVLAAAAASAQQTIAVTNVTVIDGVDAPRRNFTVIARGNRIVRVAPAQSVRVPADARVVDGRGKFLIPGLWDMHVHTAVIGGRELLELYVANGVTGIRDMGGDWETLTGWRREIADGEVVGPRILASGPYLEGGDVPIAHLTTRTPEEARTAVDSLVRLGVDFVKVHSQLTRDAPASGGSCSPGTSRASSVPPQRPTRGSGVSSTCSPSPPRVRRPSRSRCGRASPCNRQSVAARPRIWGGSTHGSSAIERG
jgi:hypothetical protein